MPGRHEQSAGRRGGLRWFVGACALALAATTAFAVSSPASATATTVKTQLSLSGLASADNPLGGSVIGIHPGDTVTFTAAGAPTAGLEKLGLDGLVNNVLGLLVTFQVSADFAGLPGGAKATVLKGAKAKSFTFPKKGTYNFTWEAQNLVVLKALPINLNGDQLAAAGIKLNESNQYVGKVVVAANPPTGGLSIQLPGVKVAPSLPVVGQLPTVSIPGVTLPTIHASVPNLLPGKPGGSTSDPAGGGTSTPASSYHPPALTVPEQVVPQGDGNAIFGAGGGGFNAGALPGTQLGNLAPISGSTATASAPLTTQDSAGKNKTIDLASSTKAPSGQLPVILAILAIIALALVAGTYARLFLLRRNV